MRLTFLILAGCGGGDVYDPPQLPSYAPLYPVPNLDDDDSDGVVDWFQVGAAGEDDLISFVVPAQDLQGGYSYKLTVDGDARLWLDGIPVVGNNTGYSGYVLVAGDSESTFGVELKDFLGRAVVTLSLLDRGDPVDAVSFDVLAAPLVLNHHLEPAEAAWAMATDFGYYGDNDAFIQGFTDVLGDRFSALKDTDYEYDVWVQDEIEFATLTASDGHRVDVVIDSIRDGQRGPGHGLDNFPEDHIEAPNFAVMTWGSGTSTSQDSFGNLDVSPPVTVDGVDYPFGRIYWGDAGGQRQINQELADFLYSQQIQAPFQLDTSWLCVGHVDEWMSFMPAASAPKGFYLIYSDIDMGRDFLTALDPALSLPRYSSGHGYATPAEILGDAALTALNDELQADYIDANLETLKAELGLTEDDIIRIPAYFEEVRGCGGGTIALIPGTANYQIFTDQDDTTHLFLPDPFLRSDPDAAPSTDPFVQAIEASLPAEHSYHWLDDWDIYHLGLGEVHCGTNVVRDPLDQWWVSGLHLLDQGSGSTSARK